VPPVDEDEQRRLAGHPPFRDGDWWWGGHLAVVDDVPVAYAGTRLAPGGQVSRAADCAARVDLAFDRRHPSAQAALRAALDDARDHAARAGATGATDGGDERHVEAWLRGATADDLATTADAGFTVKRRLHVLGVTADAIPAVREPVPDGLRLRTFDAGDPGDAAAVLALLSAAYPKRQAWYEARFTGLRDSAWFRPEDLLLLESDPGAESRAAGGADAGLLGVHWMKRRGDGVGEVYNLALSPEAQGRGFGGLLLDAGLAHLAAVGSREVILWVDAQNAPALALYRSRGFTPRWDDVSLAG